MKTATEVLHEKLREFAKPFGIEGHAEMAGFLFAAAQYEARCAGVSREEFLSSLATLSSSLGTLAGFDSHTDGASGDN